MSVVVEKPSSVPQAERPSRERIYQRVTRREPGWDVVAATRFSNGRVALLVMREPALRDDAPAGEEAGTTGEG